MLTIHRAVPQVYLGLGFRLRSGCSFTLFLLAGCAALGGCQEPTGAGADGVEILWQHKERSGARGVPYADEEIAVFTTGGSDTRVVALDAKAGTKRWETRLALPSEYRGRGFPVNGRVLGVGDVIVVAAWDLYGLDKKTGQVRWKLAPEDDFPGAGLALGDQGDLYSVGRSLYRINPASGSVLWQVDLGEQPFAPVAQDGVVYIGTRGEIPGSNGILGAGHAVALEAATGRVLWKTPIPAPEEPAKGGVVGAGALTHELFVVSSVNERMYALDRKTGKVRWVTKGSGVYEAGVVVLGDVAVSASVAGYVEGFDLTTGEQRWKVSAGSSIGAPLERAGNLALVSNGRLRAFGAGGELVWGYGGAGWNQAITSTGALARTGIIYIGTDSGFYALKRAE